MQKIFLFLFSFAIISNSFAQKNYASVDSFVSKMGSMLDKNVATIADTLTRPLKNKEDKARAIFYWITHNISQDPKAMKNNNKNNTLPEQVIKSRKTNGLGFALLFQEMASDANIRCLVIDGFVKYGPENINEKQDDGNHSWNVVQLGQSPEEWYYVDAAFGAGFMDKGFKTFTPQFMTEYFFADKQLFDYTHFPDNTAWLLGRAGAKNIKEYYAAPVVYPAAFHYKIGKINPSTGLIKTKTKKPVSFSFDYGNEIAPKNVSLIIGQGKKNIKPEPMNFTLDKGVLKFDYTFKEEGDYPVKVVINEIPVLDFLLNSSEK